MEKSLVNLNVNPCKMCMPMGSVTALYGIRKCMSILHGSQGCSTYMRRHMATHYNEPVDIASSSLTEEGTVYGGEENLLKGLKNLINLYSPEIIGVSTTCLAETIGEDVPRIIAKFYEKNPEYKNIPIISIPSAGYAGTQFEGFFKALYQIVKQIPMKSEKNNKVNVITGQISPADTRYLKSLLESFEIDYILLPDLSKNLDNGYQKEYERLPSGGTSVEEITLMAGARHSIELSTFTNKENSPAEYLYEQYGVPYTKLHLPMSLRDNDALINELKRISGNKVSKAVKEERSRFLDAMIDSHKYNRVGRAVVFGEPDFVYGTVRLLAENGVVPVLVATGSKCSNLKELLYEEIKKVAESAFVEDFEILDDVDFQTIEEYTKKFNANLLVGNSDARRIEENLHIPLVRRAFPIHDRIGGQRLLTLGYYGSLTFLDEITNTFLAKTEQGFRSELYHKYYKGEKTKYQNEKIEYQNDKINYQNEKIEYQNESINYQNEKIEYQDEKIKYQNEKIEYQNEKSAESIMRVTEGSDRKMKTAMENRILENEKNNKPEKADILVNPEKTVKAKKMDETIMDEKTIEEKTKNHPCFNCGASNNARIHLPVAPKCNISCNYCLRKFDCPNESRPGVTTKVLTPEEAFERYLEADKRVENLTVVGIAGPGDALANFEDTKKTLQLIKENNPEITFCISTNGLMLPMYANELVELGVSHVTVTMNAIDPKIGAKIYKYVDYMGIKYIGEQAASILMANQLTGIKMLTSKGIVCKVNIVMLKGINDEHIPEVVKKVKELGGTITNIMQLIPVKGSAFEELPLVSNKEIMEMRKTCGESMKQMYHCKQCRADAVGTLGDDRSYEFSSSCKGSCEDKSVEEIAAIAKEVMKNKTLKEGVSLSVQNSSGKLDLENKYNATSISNNTKNDGIQKDSNQITSINENSTMGVSSEVAVALENNIEEGLGKESKVLKFAAATKSGMIVDQHFGQVTELYIYEYKEGNAIFKEKRNINKYCNGNEECDEEGDKIGKIINTISDCDGVIAMRIGEAPSKKLENKGISVFTTYDRIEDAVKAAASKILA